MIKLKQIKMCYFILLSDLSWRYDFFTKSVKAKRKFHIVHYIFHWWCICFTAFVYVGGCPMAQAEHGYFHLILIHTAVQAEDVGCCRPATGLLALKEPL